MYIIIILIWILDGKKCWYERLTNRAKDEGNFITSFGSGGVTTQKALEECQNKCDLTHGCHSISVCPRDRCYLYDKIITKGEPEKIAEDCYTSYLMCEGITFEFHELLCIF